MSFDLLRGAEKVLAREKEEKPADEPFNFDFSSLGGDMNW
jgi:hypothetical protein